MRITICLCPFQLLALPFAADVCLVASTVARFPRRRPGCRCHSLSYSGKWLKRWMASST